MVRDKSCFHVAILLGVAVFCCLLISTQVKAGSSSKYDWHQLLAEVEYAEQSPVRAQFLAGICHANVGSLRQALEELQAVASSENRDEIVTMVEENHQKLQVDPHDLLAMNIVAFGELVLNHIDDSIAWFETITVEDPNNIWPRNLVALLYGRKNRVDKAMWHLEQALEIDPKNEYSHLLLAVGYKEQKQFAAAIYHYLQARNAVAELRKYGVQ